MATIWTAGERILRSLFGIKGAGDPPSSQDQLAGSESPQSGQDLISPQQASPGQAGSSSDRSTSENPAARTDSALASAGRQSTENALFDAMSRQALRFIEMLDDESVDEDGNPKIDLTTKMKVFDIGQQWLIRAQKLRPKSDDAEGEGIRDMRASMSDPSVRAQLADIMFQEGFVKAPPKRPGRPTKGEEPIRARYKEHTEAQKAEAGANDDSGWAGLLKDED